MSRMTVPTHPVQGPRCYLLLKGSAQDIEKLPWDEGASVPEYPRAAVLSL